jgi:hypothetical protein
MIELYNHLGQKVATRQAPDNFDPAGHADAIMAISKFFGMLSNNRVRVYPRMLVTQQVPFSYEYDVFEFVSMNDGLRLVLIDQDIDGDVISEKYKTECEHNMTRDVQFSFASKIMQSKSDNPTKIWYMFNASQKGVQLVKTLPIDAVPLPGNLPSDGMYSFVTADTPTRYKIMILGGIEDLEVVVNNVTNVIYPETLLKLFRMKEKEVQDIAEILEEIQSAGGRFTQ